MVDRRQLLELAVHYVVILVIVSVVLAVARNAVGELSFWAELAVVIALVVVYRPVVKALDVAPSAWSRGSDGE